MASILLHGLLPALLTTAPLHAAVQPTHWYRMGEGTTPDAIDSPATVLRDSLGAQDLTFGGAVSAITSGNVLTPYATNVVSTRSLQFPTAGAYAQGDLISTATEEFGFEAWICANSTTGTQCLACNGTPGVDGWALYLVDGRLIVRCGPTNVITAPFGTAWTHFALVRTGGVTTLYTRSSNSAFASTSTSSAAIFAPTGHFTLGAAPAGAGAAGAVTAGFTGFIDEARAFQVFPSTFNYQADILPAAPRILALRSTAPRSTVAADRIENGKVVDLGNVGTGSLQRVSLSMIQDFGNSLLPLLGNRLSFTAMTLSGDTAGFSFDFHLPPPGFSFANPSVHFTPTTPGPKSATISVLSNDPDDSPFLITITANVVAAPNIAVFAGPDPATAPALPSDGPAQTLSPGSPGGPGGMARTWSVRNTGLAPLHLGTPFFLGPDGASFTVSSPPAAAPLAPGESTTFTVNFAPSATGTRFATLILPSDAADIPAYHLPLRATATGPQLQLTGPDGSDLRSRAVIAWGSNSSHQTDVPAGLGDVTAIATGDDYTAALRSDGAVVVWGANAYRQTDVPAALGPVTAIAGGQAHLLALRQDGTVAAWGRNDSHQADIPAGLTGIRALAAGRYHSAALGSDGSVTAWGDPDFTAVPPGLGGVIAIDAADDLTLVLRNDGTVAEWGTSPNYAASVPAGLDHVTAIAADELPVSLALKDDGAVIAWDIDSQYPSPFPATSSDIVALAAGDGDSAALRHDGSVALLSSDNAYGQLQAPAGLRKTTAIACGNGHFVALYDSLVDFSTLDPAHPGTPQIFTVTNSGTAPLHLTAAGLTGPGAARFELNAASFPATLPPGGTAPLAVAFNPQAGDPAEDAALQIFSDSPGQPAFTIQLTSKAFTAPSPYAAWKLQHFPANGDSADDADPNHNGIPNLLEYALGGDPTGTTANSSTLPKYSLSSSSAGQLSFSRAPPQLRRHSHRPGLQFPRQRRLDRPRPQHRRRHLHRPHTRRFRDRLRRHAPRQRLRYRRPRQRRLASALPPPPGHPPLSQPPRFLRAAISGS